jgi:hypothetical protein
MSTYCSSQNLHQTRAGKTHASPHESQPDALTLQLCSKILRRYVQSSRPESPFPLVYASHQAPQVSKLCRPRCAEVSNRAHFSRCGCVKPLELRRYLVLSPQHPLFFPLIFLLGKLWRRSLYENCSKV